MSQSLPAAGPLLPHAPAAAPRSISRHIFGTFASNVTLLVLGIASSVILNRTLGPEGKGAYATLITLSQFIVVLASIGGGKSITYHLASRDENQKMVLGSTLLMLILSAGVCLGLAVITGFFINSTGLPVHTRMACLALFALCSVTHTTGLCALRGLKQFTACNIQSVVTSVIFIGLILAWGCAGSLSPQSTIALKAGSLLAGLALIVYQLKSAGLHFHLAANPRVLKSLFAYGSGLFLYTFFQNLSYRFDLLLVANLTGLASTGCYSTATGLAEIIWYFPNAIGAVLFPVMAGMHDDEAARLAAKVCRWSMLIMTLGVIGLAAVAPIAVPFLYGPTFTPTVPVIYALSLGIVTNAMFQVLGSHLAARKQLRQLTIITAASFVINLLLNLLFIPRWGIVGAGISSTISYSISGFLTAWVFIRSTRSGWTGLFHISKVEAHSVTRSILTKLRLARS